MNAPSPSTFALLVFVPLITWRMVSRIRRTVGRQRLSVIRLWITLVVYAMLILLLGLTTLVHPERLWWLGGGFAVGAMLGRFGLSKTSFESTPAGLFYTPNVHLGVALALLFVGRIAFRFVEVYDLDPAKLHGGPDGFARSPFTLAVFGLLAGYYISYALGLIRWRFGVLKAKRAREAELK